MRDVVVIQALVLPYERRREGFRQGLKADYAPLCSTEDEIRFESTERCGSHPGACAGVRFIVLYLVCTVWSESALYVVPVLKS